MEPGNSQGRIHVVDDDPAFAKAIERRLTQAGYSVTTHATAQHLLDNMPGGDGPGCILLDVRLPDLDGPTLQERLAELGSTLPIIFLSGHADTPTVVRTVKAGAHDFLNKPVQSDELLRALEKALADQQAWRDQQSALDSIRTRIATLTPREREVFELLICGNTSKKIGLALGATERTIKAHRQRVMEKMQVRTLAELVSLAERAGVSGRTPTGD